MEKSCKNCRNHTWGDEWWNCPPLCLKCEYIVKKGSKVPSKWKAMPMTHADRIRAMTDEELAKLLLKAPLCRAESRAACRSTKSCLECLMEWLQQPAEEGGEDGK